MNQPKLFFVFRKREGPGKSDFMHTASLTWGGVMRMSTGFPKTMDIRNVWVLLADKGKFCQNEWEISKNATVIPASLIENYLTSDTQANVTCTTHIPYGLNFFFFCCYMRQKVCELFVIMKKKSALGPNCNILKVSLGKARLKKNSRAQD